MFRINARCEKRYIMPKKKSKRRRAQAAGTGIGNEIKEAMKGNRLLIGSNCVLRDIKKGNIQSLILSTNLPAARKKELNSQASVAGIEVKEYEGDSAKLGEACGKPFNILLIGIKK